MIKYSIDKDIENHIIFTINKELIPKYSIPQIEGAVSIIVFYYSPKWNFYYTCKKLEKLIQGEDAILIAHDWLELGMVSHLGLQNSLVLFLHGNYPYYYKLASLHASSVNIFICVSDVISQQLVRILPERKKDIFYCRFPVPDIVPLEKKTGPLKLFYCVRSLHDDNKQFWLLPEINAILSKRGCTVHWTIIGTGFTEDEAKTKMGTDEVAYFQSLPNEEVLQKLAGKHIFILPSLREGFPVSLVEAMKAGLVPLITDWEGSVNELVIPGVTGFYYSTGDASGYAEEIIRLDNERSGLQNIGKHAILKANSLFDPHRNTQILEKMFSEASLKNINVKPVKKIYGSRLDHPLIPNIITYTIRKWKQSSQ